MKKYKLIIKKEILECWINYESIYSYNHKWLKYYFTKWYYEHKKFKYNGEKKNYIVEEIEDDSF